MQQPYHETHEIDATDEIDAACQRSNLGAKPRDEGLSCGVMRISWYDSVTSMLTALMLFLGTLVALLAIVWMLSGATEQTDPGPGPQITVSTANPEGIEQEFLEPGAEEIVELNEPEMQETLLAVTDAVSSVAGSLQTSVVRRDGQEGENSLGSSRPPGPSMHADPRFERWQLDFTAKNIDVYARQLDYYGIELGLIGGSIQGVDYASELSTRPRLRRGQSDTEKRLYFMWTRPSPLMAFDRRLLRRAGAEVESREMLKFIPPELENQLAKIELEYASARGHESLKSVVKTVFTSKPVGDRYQFVVSEQRYRKRND